MQIKKMISKRVKNADEFAVIKNVTIYDWTHTHTCFKFLF